MAGAVRCRDCGWLGPEPVCADCRRRAGEVKEEETAVAAVDPVLDRKLAVAVITQAVSDVATHVARHGQTWVETTAGGLARRFLLEDLWTPGNHWGDAIRDLLRPSMREVLERYCNGLQVRPMTGGTRLKRPNGREVAPCQVCGMPSNARGYCRRCYYQHVVKAPRRLEDVAS